MNVNKLFLIAVIAFLLGLSIGVIIGRIDFSGSLTGDVVLDEHTYTRAICNENKCIDVVITCFGGEVVSISPISELVNMGEDWEDIRNNESFC